MLRPVSPSLTRPCASVGCRRRVCNTASWIFSVAYSLSVLLTPLPVCCKPLTLSVYLWIFFVFLYPVLILPMFLVVIPLLDISESFSVQVLIFRSLWLHSLSNAKGWNDLIVIDVDTVLGSDWQNAHLNSSKPHAVRPVLLKVKNHRQWENSVKVFLLICKEQKPHQNYPTDCKYPVTLEHSDWPLCYWTKNWLILLTFLIIW